MYFPTKLFPMIFQSQSGSTSGLMANVTDCEACEFEPQSHHCVHFQTNNLCSSNGLNSIIAVLLQGWIW